MDVEHSTKSPWPFFLLILALSLPIYILSPLVHSAGLPKNMPLLDGLLAFTPLVAAMILTFRSDGTAGVRRLVKRVVDIARIKPATWYLPILLLAPGTLIVTFALMQILGIHLSDQPRLPVAAMLILPVVFLIAATGEEAGWTGYATDALQEQWSPLTASLILGAVWWIWHIPSIIASGQPLVLIALGAVAAVASRVLWVWIYNGTASVSAIIIAHAIANICGSFVPSVPTAATAPVTALVALAVTILCALTGTKSRARNCETGTFGRGQAQ